jgi:mRNA interferase HigB
LLPEHETAFLATVDIPPKTYAVGMRRGIVHSLPKKFLLDFQIPFLSVFSLLKQQSPTVNKVFILQTFCYLYKVNVIVKRAILFYCDKYPAAKVALLGWYKEFCDVDYKNFNELKQEYANASLIANSRVIFNIKHNEYRLVVSVNFKQLAAYIIWFGTHKQYDKIDAATIKFDTKILNYKS